MAVSTVKAKILIDASSSTTQIPINNGTNKSKRSNPNGQLTLGTRKFNHA